MKKIILAAAIIAAFACVAAAQRVGGYQEVPTSDATARSAAQFAAVEQGKKIDRTINVISISKAEMQVVAGRNYRLCIKVESTGGEDEADAIFFVQTVVYFDLKGNKKLTSWEPAECGEDEDVD